MNKMDKSYHKVVRHSKHTYREMADLAGTCEGSMRLDHPYRLIEAQPYGGGLLPPNAIGDLRSNPVHGLTGRLRTEDTGTIKNLLYGGGLLPPNAIGDLQSKSVLAISIQAFDGGVLNNTLSNIMPSPPLCGPSP